MADFEFTLSDVQNLAQRLSSVQPDLTHQEYVLLLAIFAAAAAQAKVVPGAKTPTATLPEPKFVGQPQGPLKGYTDSADLQRQLLNAYIPGNYFEDLDTRTAKTVGLRDTRALLANRQATERGQTDR